MRDELFRLVNSTLGTIVACALIGALNTPIFAVALAWCITKLSLKLFKGLTIV